MESVPRASPCDNPRLSARSAAERFLNAGFVPVPIPYGEKGPRRKEWEKLRLEDYPLKDMFPQSRQLNIGLLLGEPSGGLIDVDKVDHLGGEWGVEPAEPDAAADGGRESSS